MVNVETGYDADNNRTQRTDANGNGSQTVYDERNRVAQTIDALGNVTQFEYDAAGQMTAQIDANGNRTEYDYDELGRRVAVTDALGNVTRTEYDKAGRVTAQIDGLGKETRFEYDDRDRQIATIDPLGSVTTTTYDDLGNVLSITDAVNNTTTYVYDDLNRLIEETNELGATRFYRYDAQSNRVAAIDRNGRERAFVYDGLNRQVEEQWLDELGTVTRSTRSVYDAAGQMIEVSDPDSTYRYSYDALGRQVTVDNVGTPDVPNVVLTYAYDDVGNLVSVSDTIDGQAGGINTYGYDELNRMTQLTQSGNGVSEKRVDFTYSPVGQFESISRYSDLAGTSPVVTTTYDYDENNRLERLSHHNSSAEVAFYDFSYDAAHRISGITDIDGTTDYSYNDWDELTGADHSDVGNPDESYSYDANGNRVSSSLHGSDYVTGSNNQLMADGVYTYEYDAEGNLTKQTETATGDVRVFEWDYRNRLVAVIDSDVAGTEVQQVAYTYDAMGRRIAKAVDADGVGSAAAETLRFVYDRDDVLLEFEGEGVAPSQRYLHGPQVDQVLAQEDAVGETLWHLTDHLGTVKDLANDAGEVVNHRSYDSYGNLITQSNSSFDSRYGFTGREFDEEIGLYYYRARYFDPAAGKFTSEDPLGFNAIDTNFYRYVFNSPINYTDSSGLLVDILYEKAQQRLTIEDLDTGETIVVNNVFSGTSDGEYVPIPSGTYDIFNVFDWPDFYRLDRHDLFPNNDHTGFRGDFRLHPGTVSHGCITVPNDQEQDWGNIERILENTSTEITFEQQGRLGVLRRIWGNAPELIYYGTATVVDHEAIPYNPRSGPGIGVNRSLGVNGIVE
ncbi:MAG: RHS repeat-associated core domain-containing protein [Cyanobacteria bacterium J06631_12]